MGASALSALASALRPCAWTPCVLLVARGRVVAPGAPATGSELCPRVGAVGPCCHRLLLCGRVRLWAADRSGLLVTGRGSPLASGDVDSDAQSSRPSGPGADARGAHLRCFHADRTGLGTPPQAGRGPDLGQPGSRGPGQHGDRPQLSSTPPGSPGSWSPRPLCEALLPGAHVCGHPRLREHRRRKPLRPRPSTGRKGQSVGSDSPEGTGGESSAFANGTWGSPVGVEEGTQDYWQRTNKCQRLSRHLRGRWGPWGSLGRLQGPRQVIGPLGLPRVPPAAAGPAQADGPTVQPTPTGPRRGWAWTLEGGGGPADPLTRVPGHTDWLRAHRCCLQGL